MGNYMTNTLSREETKAHKIEWKNGKCKWGQKEKEKKEDSK